MKKKQLNLNKKLFLGKEMLVALNNQQTAAMLGGDWYTNREYCDHTQYQTNCDKCTNNTLEAPAGPCN